jgi:Zn-dependent metalloprotease
MSDAAQKELSRLRQQIVTQKGLIDREEAVISQLGDSYLLIRAKTKLESTERKLANLEDIFKNDIETMTTSYERKAKDLEEQYNADLKALERSSTFKLDKLKSSYEEYKMKYESDIKASLSMIESQTTKKPPTIIRAETAIEGLRARIESIRSGWETNIVVPRESSQSVKPTTLPANYWEEVEKQQLEDMSPAERQFFEESQNRKEVKEEVFTFEGRKVSKWEYNRLTAPPREKYSGPKKPIKTCGILFNTPLEIPPI